MMQEVRLASHQQARPTDLPTLSQDDIRREESDSQGLGQNLAGSLLQEPASLLAWPTENGEPQKVLSWCLGRASVELVGTQVW